MPTLTNDQRKQKMTMVMLDDDTRTKLDELAAMDEDDPGNRSKTIRQLIRDEYRRHERRNK